MGNKVLGFTPSHAPAPFNRLTPRERQVAWHLSHGRDHHAISKLTGAAVKTIDTHRSHVLEKLGTTNNVTLTRLAIRVGFVTAHVEDAPCTCGQDATATAAETLELERVSGGEK